MAVSFRYKSGGMWFDVPDAAHPDDEGGEIALVRPEPTGRDGNGLPCGAVGRPAIIVRSRLMRGDGWNFWNAFFSNDGMLSTTALEGLTALDPRTGQWRGCTSGILLRPTGKCRAGASAATTLYEEVEIIYDGVTVG